MGKNVFKFFGVNFLAPKIGHWLEKQPVLWPAHGFSTSFLVAARKLIFSRKYTIWHFISTPTPFQERHKNFYENVLPLNLVSTTCKLTPFQMQLESGLNSLYQKQPSRGVLRKMCSQNMHAANLITGEHPCQSAIYWTHTSTWVLSCKFAAYFQSIFS